MWCGVVSWRVVGNSSGRDRERGGETDTERDRDRETDREGNTEREKERSRVHVCCNCRRHTHSLTSRVSLLGITRGVMIGVHVLSQQHHLLHTLRGQVGHLLEDAGDVSAPLPPPSEGNDAICQGEGNGKGGGEM